MPYGDFAVREDVYGIISKTLTEYYGMEVRVAEKSEKIDSGCSMYCFPRIGIVIPRKACRQIREQVKREYRITYSLHRKVVMNLYIAGVFFLPWLLCEKKLIFPPGIVNQEMFIEPGNKKIKIVDYRNGTIENIIKSGFGKRWIQNEILIRNAGKEYLIPLSETNDGYMEQIHCGYSFPRLTKEEKSNLLPNVMDIISDFSGQKEYVDAKNYVNNLVKSISKRIDALNLTGKFPVGFEKIKMLSEALATRFSTDQISLCRSHGDLQEGNLFYDIDEKKVYLIDMETYKKRSSYYDFMLFYYGFRNASKFIENIEDLKGDKGQKLGNGALDEDEVMDMIRLFVLEDTEWQLDEMEVMPQGTVSNGIRIYVENLYDWMMDNLT